MFIELTCRESGVECVDFDVVKEFYSTGNELHIVYHDEVEPNKFVLKDKKEAFYVYKKLKDMLGVKTIHLSKDVTPKPPIKATV